MRCKAIFYGSPMYPCIQILKQDLMSKSERIATLENELTQLQGKLKKILDVAGVFLGNATGRVGGPCRENCSFEEPSVTKSHVMLVATVDIFSTKYLRGLLQLNTVYCAVITCLEVCNWLRLRSPDVF